MAITLKTHYPKLKITKKCQNEDRCNHLVALIAKKGNGIKTSVANITHAKFTSAELIKKSGCPMNSLHGEVICTNNGIHTALGYHFESVEAGKYGDALIPQIIDKILDEDYKGVECINEEITEPKNQNNGSWYNIRIELTPNITDDEIVIIALGCLNILTALI